MPDRKYFLAPLLLLLTGIACAVLPGFFQTPAPTQNFEQTLISLNNSLTRAIQTYQAGFTNLSTPIPSQDPTPINSNLLVLGKHHVAYGETLECIGRGYGVSPEAIVAFNHIDPNAKLQTGQALEIPALKWANIPAGPTCPAQFVIPNWELSSDDKPQTAITSTAKTQPTKLIIVSTQPNLVLEEPPIQKPPPGISLPTWTPLSPPPPAPPPTITSIPITPPSLPPCFPPPCLPPIPPFP